MKTIIKYTLLICVIITCCFTAFAQTEAQRFKDSISNNKYLTTTELLPKLEKYDYAGLFTHTDNSEVFGFIGKNYQRLRIKFISVKKASPGTYIVKGKSMVKGNVCDFNGTLTISSIRKYKSISYGADSTYADSGIKGEYVLLGSYNLAENHLQRYSGKFTGVFETDFYLDNKNIVHYDDINMDADGYSNNLFVGRWAAYGGNFVERCNWGDYRIPNDGDLDTGAGDFSPADRYLKFGWQTVRDAGFPGPKSKKTPAAENIKWWE